MEQMPDRLIGCTSLGFGGLSHNSKNSTKRPIRCIRDQMMENSGGCHCWESRQPSSWGWLQRAPSDPGGEGRWERRAAVPGFWIPGQGGVS